MDCFLSLMEANSDSALVALGMLDSLREDNPKMSKAQQMRFDLIFCRLLTASQ